ncbi:ABC transporter ATP-binding protein [Hamadaea tsunoensis]|uniref:ABC transporter ATP-binding protein n=1 Tax=Hamadaea tsunoensis TaxID=53368 RepID=UPI00054E8E31|nr:ABC transporter ATP-binding protein [Hamadaea tsunoensis]
MPPKVGLRSLWPYVRDHRTSLLVVAVLSLVSSAATLIQPLLTRNVIDGISAGHAVSATVVLLVTALIVVAALDGVRGYLLQRTAEGLVLTARQRMAARILRLPISEYDARRTGDLLSRVGADTTLLRAVVTSGLFETVTGALMVVGATTAMILLDPVLFGVTIVALAIGLAGGIITARRIRGLSVEAQARIGEMTSAVERAISAARTIRASRAEERETDAINGSARRAYQAGLRIARLQSTLGPVMVTTIQASFLLVLGVGGARVAHGTISVGDLVSFVLYVFFLVMPLGQAMNAYTQLQTGLGALGRMEEILALPAETDKPGAGFAVVPAAPAVEFRGVSFEYAQGSAPILTNVSFSVPAGSRTALVGPSGAGKSTLLSLVERFYDVSSGAVLVHGVDIRDMPYDVLRSQLGYVEQEAPVLAGTLRDNLRLASPGVSEHRMLDVLSAVNLGDLATRTEAGLDAEVGEGGVLLSGGERQRLAIARTLLAAPAILLLDEPTSNLDARNEAALRSAIDTVAVGRTLLIVAHRLSTVVDADQIVVLEHGSVAAVGTHAELVETSPLYREFAANQLLVSPA